MLPSPEMLAREQAIGFREDRDDLGRFGYATGFYSASPVAFTRHEHSPEVRTLLWTQHEATADALVQERGYRPTWRRGSGFP